MEAPGGPKHRAGFILPFTNGVVTAVVEYICYTHVLIRLIEINGYPTISAQGVIHREDAMYGIKDEDKLSDLFSPGDTIYGRILSLGSTGPVIVSTADPAHGVILAVDFETQNKIPINGNKIVYNGVILKRKIAEM